LKRGQQQPVDLVPAQVMSRPLVFQVGVAFLNLGRAAGVGQPFAEGFSISNQLPVGWEREVIGNRQSEIDNDYVV